MDRYPANDSTVPHNVTCGDCGKAFSCTMPASGGKVECPHCSKPNTVKSIFQFEPPMTGAKSNEEFEREAGTRLNDIREQALHYTSIERHPSGKVEIIHQDGGRQDLTGLAGILELSVDSIVQDITKRNPSIQATGI